MLFEMLTGSRAFDGASTTEVIASVPRTEPDWSRLPPSTPEGAKRVLRRCLERDRRRRLGDIRDACLDLEEAQTGGTAPTAITVGRRERLLWIGASTLLAAVAAWSLLTPLPPEQPSREVRVEVVTPAPALLAPAIIGPGGTWSRDGVILYPMVPDSPLFRVPASERASPPLRMTTAAPDGGGQRYPQFLSDGRHFLYYAVNALGGAALSASATGSIAYRSGPAAQERQFVWFDRSGKRVGVVGAPDTLAPANLQLSPNGREVVYSRTREATPTCGSRTSNGASPGG